ncbi:MAG: hypothetical protein JOY53_00675 [Acidobacteriaceae bacterium]|nr:hypothetical protein [Acidobacteriaceae bacterium]
MNGRYKKVNTSNASTQGKLLTWMGILLIALEGLIHLLDAPGSFDDATYKGLLFMAIVLGAAVASIGIYQGRRWGWSLGALIAGSAFLGYVISRTIGLPGLPVDEWLEPLGILSLLVESLFLGLYLVVPIPRSTSLN